MTNGWNHILKSLKDFLVIKSDTNDRNFQKDFQHETENL